MESLNALLLQCLASALKDLDEQEIRWQNATEATQEKQEELNYMTAQDRVIEAARAIARTVPDYEEVRGG